MQMIPKLTATKKGNYIHNAICIGLCGLGPSFVLLEEEEERKRSHFDLDRF